MSELPDVDESKTTLSFAAPFRKVHRSFNWGKREDLENLEKKIRLFLDTECMNNVGIANRHKIYMNALSL
jgi:hypothetical protein